MKSRQGPDYQALRERLVAARRDNGLTQSQVAEQLGKPQSYVSKCETGERRVDAVELSWFAEIYARPLDWFVERPKRKATAKRGPARAQKRTARRR